MGDSGFETSLGYMRLCLKKWKMWERLSYRITRKSLPLYIYFSQYSHFSKFEWWKITLYMNDIGKPEKKPGRVSSTRGNNKALFGELLKPDSG